MHDDEVLTMAEAAAELDMTVAEFITLLTWEGLVLEHPDGGYVPGPHPDLVQL